MTGRVESVATSRGGVPKESAFEITLTPAGVRGDVQRDLRYHGGPDRAVVLYSLDVIRDLQREGHPITVGATGENITVSGIDWPAVTPGTRLLIGEQVRLEITAYATPCAKVRQFFMADDYMRIAHKKHPGWSRLCARVLDGGVVRAGDPVVAQTG